MVATNPKGRPHFQKLLNKPGDCTPPTRREVEVVGPISRVEVIIILPTLLLNLLRKVGKKDKGSRQSHSSPRRHRHGVGNSSQPLLESIFGASSRLSDFVHTNLDGPSWHMFRSTNVSSLADGAIELST